MRIDRQTNFPSDRLQKSVVEVKVTDTFANVIKKSESKLQLDSLNQLMNRVDTQGQKLAKQRTLDNLIEYKNLVKKFIRESLSYGLKLSEKQSFNSSGGMKSHQLVEVIDQKLIELHDEVITNEKEGIDTLRQVGEIKGLLINLYM
ncbi:YaaR family protein [Paenisporosarcina sp. TG-14]|uniref:YaaR family protein n=1 Tax=Paenisporosarcina sp. TG-14 TaxID=1231057 RepID=UPI0002E5DA5E|nr:YaaR family protein [Paenisporosarcina sp. TG-14]